LVLSIFNSPALFLTMKRVFNSPTQIYLWKQGLSDVLLFCDPFTFGLRVFSTVLPNSTYESRDWCAALCDFLCLQSIFQQSHPIPPMSRDWVMCCSFVIPFFTFGLKSIFQQSHPILPMKAGIEWCAAPLWFLSTFVLEYFSTVLPNFYLWKQGLSDVLLFVISCVWS
jgi:hypothetical protein